MPRPNIQVGKQNLTATPEDGGTTRALLARLPMPVTMGELGAL